MKIISVTGELLEAFSCDKELMLKKGRPCVLVIRLLYKGKNQDFAVPFRSNISANTPKWQYFPLPPRRTTEPGKRHGIHYIKMFPVAKKYFSRYHIEGNEFSLLLQKKIDNHEKEIVTNCQLYLDRYGQGARPAFSTDLDMLLSVLQGIL